MPRDNIDRMGLVLAQISRRIYKEVLGPRLSHLCISSTEKNCIESLPSNPGCHMTWFEWNVQFPHASATTQFLRISWIIVFAFPQLRRKRRWLRRDNCRNIKNYCVCVCITHFLFGIAVVLPLSLSLSLCPSKPRSSLSLKAPLSSAFFIRKILIAYWKMNLH